MHHDVVCMEKSYAEVLTTCSDFLSAYPSETILLSVSNEDRADSALGIFAPSQVLCRLSSIGDTPHSGENTRSFEDTFRAITWEHLKDAPLAPFYDVEDRYQNPGGDDKFDFVVAHLEEARVDADIVVHRIERDIRVRKPRRRRRQERRRSRAANRRARAKGA